MTTTFYFISFSFSTLEKFWVIFWLAFALAKELCFRKYLTSFFNMNDIETIFSFYTILFDFIKLLEMFRPKNRVVFTCVQNIGFRAFLALSFSKKHNKCTFYQVLFQMLRFFILFRNFFDWFLGQYWRTWLKSPTSSYFFYKNKEETPFFQFFWVDHFLIIF